MENFKKLNILAKNIYGISIFNINKLEEKKINIGIVAFYGDNVHNAFFSCLDDGFHYQNITSNIFTEYQNFRDPLENDGWRFKTKGALKNAHTSAMQVDSVLGAVAYIIERGTFNFESFNIFDYEDSISENDTVAEQNKFWENYTRSPSDYVHGKE